MSGIILPDLYPISWFERVWTLQEVALARRVILLTARKSTDYDKIMFELNYWLYTKNAKYLSGELLSRENEVGTQLLLARQTIRALGYKRRRKKTNKETKGGFRT
jgi:hypothetical protein